MLIYSHMSHLPFRIYQPYSYPKGKKKKRKIDKTLTLCSLSYIIICDYFGTKMSHSYEIKIKK